MKATGIVRKIDELGRIVIPKELRRSFDIVDDKDALEIYTEGNSIILKKHEPSCLFCEEAGDIIKFKGRSVCSNCVRQMYNLVPKEKK